MQVRYPIRSLEDFLIGTPLNADANSTTAGMPTSQ